MSLCVCVYIYITSVLETPPPERELLRGYTPHTLPLFAPPHPPRATAVIASLFPSIIEGQELHTAHKAMLTASSCSGKKNPKQKKQTKKKIRQNQQKIPSHLNCGQF